MLETEVYAPAKGKRRDLRWGFARDIVRDGCRSQIEKDGWMDDLVISQNITRVTSGYVGRIRK
ncbi:hypothetical protein BofuT4_uP131470.1 [Botrytis cinerea T4]|uniref:Uncharacterized protein n=1 Tax=Botryotinia fuckeliana (strain T4) TaxID=999810 RepID=G2YQR9_BOTF4|nr:hypothetical protein BofuT4_uP131470.1 [Botrytis cinerea T4]